MDYEKILKGIVQIINTTEKSDIGFTNICTYIGKNCPELKESKDERISREITEFILTHRIDEPNDIEDTNTWLAWLEKQGNTNETINRDEFAQGVLRGAAINLITWIDYNAAEGNMCLSNIECKDIEDAFVSGDWNKIYAYIKKKLEKQGEQKSIFDFNANNWYVSKVDGKIHNIYNSGVEPKFSEKKELKKIVPIFNIGDTIAKKHNSDINKFGQFTITDISNGKYWYDESIICGITEQDDWELVEQKSAKWSEEDDGVVACISSHLKQYLNDEAYTSYRRWLESLKQRMEEQQ